MGNADKNASGWSTEGVWGVLVAIVCPLLLAAATFTPWVVVIVSLS